MSPDAKDVPSASGTLARGDFRIEKIIFESRPEFYVTANLYLPSGGTGPYPAILFPLGWILLLASGYQGDSSGGSEVVWRVGGLMVYAVPPLVLLAALTQLTRIGVDRCRRRRAACQ